MARIVSEHFNNRGIPKKAFATRDDAKGLALLEGKQIYRCKVCFCFHIGGTKRWRRKKKTARWLGDPREVERCRQRRRYKNENAARQASKHHGGEPYECSVPLCNGWHLEV